MASYVSVPSNATGGFQNARTGQGYIGLFTWLSDISEVREYAEVELLDPLEAGICYRVKLFVNMPNDHPYAVDRFGAHFSIDPVGSLDGFVLPQMEHIGNPIGSLITDTLGWTEISGIYTAIGGETHLTIGNFNNDANTQQLQVANGVWYQTSGYLLVDDVSVEAIGLSVDLGPDTLICGGSGIVLNAATTDATYLWDDGSTNATRSITGTGTYWVDVMIGGCVAADTVEVGVLPLPFVPLPNDTLLCPNSSLSLDLSDANGTVIWSDGDTSRTRLIFEAGTYVVNVSNACGSGSDAIVIGHDLCPCVPYLPNAFSPNNDGINDTVGPQFTCGSGDLQWTLFDRWGRKVFQAFGSTARWDGTIAGKEAPVGVYVWRIDLLGVPTEQTDHTGHIVLVR